ncbi:hypothetical protein BCR42DRAFT_405339 [Absidia repens]|uniref:Zn(2)-C6 fungal-type domain-containing protein n=1 Tax=Absidia repens TaxID=90262 RepID=A0A1X2ITA2_9FUNG|nr:hypothetical protein BCR42DRAFT_405339 [Absidia repens]
MSSGASSKAFNKRLKPCLRCKTQRRKCDRPSETSDCYRCIKSNRECIYDDGTGDAGDESIDGNLELQKLTQNVASLQESLQHMEIYLQQERFAHTNSKSNSTLEGTNMAPFNQLESPSPYATSQDSPFSVYINCSDSPLSTLQLSPIAAQTSTFSSTESANSHYTTPMDEDKEYEWELSFVDGKLRLDSSIRSFDELTAYGNALRQYLSPFAGVFNNTSFLFETIQPKSLMPMIIRVVSKRSLNRQWNKLLTNNASMWNKYHFMLKRHHPAVLLAAAGKEPPISCIDELVRNYFTCYNPGLPMIHAPSYMAEYETVVRPNPTKHAITMAFCCCMCASTCRHLTYNNYERRILADYFYDRAVDALGDFFDDPDRRLETLMTINFLAQYHQIMLRITEARKWCTIGYMIAKDLYQEYESHQKEQPQFNESTTGTATSIKDPSSPYSMASTATATSSSSSNSSASSSSLPSTPTPTPTLPEEYSTTSTHHHCQSSTIHTAISSKPLESKYLPELTPVTTDRNLAMFRRHYVMSICSQKVLDLLLDHNPATWDMLSSRPILYLEDECEMTYTFIGIYNKSLQLLTHPVVLELKEQTHRMQLGEKAKVTLELILRFDQVYKDWWKSLPPEFRLCEQDPADVACRPLIEKCPNPMQLIVFLLAVIHKAEANIALTKPSNQYTVSEDTNYGLLRAIQERALNDAYECVESLTLALKRLESNKLFCIFTSDLLLWVSDLMCTLSASPSQAVKSRAQRRLTESLLELRNVRFMEGNLVPPALSPLAFMNSTEKSTSSTLPSLLKSDNLSFNVMELYQEYTLPGLAFGYDILRMASESE